MCSWPKSSSQHPTSLLLVFQTHLWLTALPILARRLCHARSTFQPPLLHHTRKPGLSIIGTGLSSEFQQCSMVFNKSLQNTVHQTHLPNNPHLGQLQSQRAGQKLDIISPLHVSANERHWQSEVMQEILWQSRKPNTDLLMHHLNNLFPKRSTKKLPPLPPGTQWY